MGCDGIIDDMLRIRVSEAGLDKEIFTFVACIRAFNINEPINAELFHEFYSTYEFDEVCAGDELQSKKITRFRLEDNWYDKIQKNDLWLLSMFDARHQNGYANVAWVIAKWLKRKGVGTQKESQICCGQFISKLAKKCMVLTEDVVRSLSAPIYCKDLDTTTLRDLIDSDGKLILEDPQPGVHRVGIPIPLRASIQVLYDRMGRMEIRQEAIEDIKYRQSYLLDRYHGVFEHMVGVYSVPLQGAYNSLGYAQTQYDQYYQQYQPPPLQYQQQQDDDE
nr:hypothetical protein [Tanacetum cinerariifolium]